MYSIKRLFLNQIRGYASSVSKQTGKLCVFIGYLMSERQKSLGIRYDATFQDKYRLYITTDKSKQIAISNTIRLKHEIRTFIFDKLPEAKKDQNEAQQVKDILEKTIDKLDDLEINTVIFLNPDATLEEVGMYVEDRYHKDIREISEGLKIDLENIIGSIERLIYKYRMIMLYKNKNELQDLLQDRSFTDNVGQTHYGWCKSLEYLNRQCVVGDDQTLETLEKTIYNIDLLAHKIIDEITIC